MAEAPGVAGCRHPAILPSRGASGRSWIVNGSDWGEILESSRADLDQVLRVSNGWRRENQIMNRGSRAGVRHQAIRPEGSVVWPEEDMTFGQRECRAPGDHGMEAQHAAGMRARRKVAACLPCAISGRPCLYRVCDGPAPAGMCRFSNPSRLSLAAGRVEHPAHCRVASARVRLDGSWIPS